MKDFDLRKYLAENKLLKEEIDSQEKEKYESFKIAMENEFEGAMRAMDQSPEEYLQDIINYSKEFLDTKDGEYRIEYEDEDDNRNYIKIKASSEEEAEQKSSGLDGFRTLKSIELVTPLDEFDLSGFFEVENGVDRGDYTKEEAINFMKQWAKNKLSSL